MTGLNRTFATQLELLGLRIPEILLPNSSVELRSWAVVACDQYTSDEGYWKTVEAAVGSAPSTLRLVLPEIYLGSPDVPERVKKIHARMSEYLEQGVLASKGECLVYVRRTTARSGLREGLVVAVDLERYEYSRGSKSLIRATEGTIVDRIPPRLSVRRRAPLELPHIMVLVEDPAHQLIEGLGVRCNEFEKIYDVQLMQEGGRLEGYRIDKAPDIEGLLTYLVSLLEQAKQRQHSDTPMLWAMGDGNHSLATAKANWEEVKRELSDAGRASETLNHPARWALVELVNVYSKGLRFEPIHRAIFTSRTEDLRASLRVDPAIRSLDPTTESELLALLSAPSGQDKAGVFDGKAFFVINWTETRDLPPAQVDGLFQRFQKSDPAAKIDFIHGWEDNRKLAGESAVAFFVPVLERDRLFSRVGEQGPLPRKAFSMGDAEEKRFYMEARRITR
ncbi:MAG TPA: DUF1015 domain-containing protein [Polyangiaceae bacterium]